MKFNHGGFDTKAVRDGINLNRTLNLIQSNGCTFSVLSDSERVHIKLSAINALSRYLLHGGHFYEGSIPSDVLLNMIWAIDQLSCQTARGSYDTLGKDFVEESSRIVMNWIDEPYKMEPASESDNEHLFDLELPAYTAHQPTPPSLTSEEPWSEDYP